MLMVGASRGDDHDRVEPRIADERFGVGYQRPRRAARRLDQLPMRLIDRGGDKAGATNHAAEVLGMEPAHATQTDDAHAQLSHAPPSGRLDGRSRFVGAPATPSNAMRQDQ
jgi:hypothetical protein